MEKFKPYVKLILFFSSYAPLALIMAIKLHNQGQIGFNIVFPFELGNFKFSYWSIVLLAVFTISVTLLYGLIRVHKRRGVEQLGVDKYKQRNELLSSYLIVYVFTFASIDFTKVTELVVFLVFFTMIAGIQIRSEMLHVNPMLGVRGYRVYEVTSDEQVLLVITKSNIEEKLMSQQSSNIDRKKIELTRLGPATYLAS